MTSGGAHPSAHPQLGLAGGDVGVRAYQLAADEHLQTAIRGLRQKAAEGVQG